MSQDTTALRSATRRAFLKSGALLAAPVAAVPIPAVALADDAREQRLRRLEDAAALRELQASWLRRVNAGEPDPRLGAGVHRMLADEGGAPERIEFAADGASAVGCFDYAVEMAAPLAADCTLAQMAHAQGHGSVRRAERRRLRVDYTRASGRWAIDQVAWVAP